MDSKLTGALIGLAVAAAFGLIWSVLGKGVEGTVADNPKIVSMEKQIKELEKEIDDDRLRNTEVHARVVSELEQVVRNSDQDRDTLRTVITLLRGD